MGFFKNLINDAAEELKKKAEEAKNQMIQNVKSQFDDTRSTNYSVKESNYSSSNDFDIDEEDDEPKIHLGKIDDGVLIINEGFTKLDDESLDEYVHLRKIVFPASLEQLDSDVISEQEDLEEVDFSKVTKLKNIPEEFIYGEHKLSRFVIPDGVTNVGEGFLGDAKSGTEVFVPASVTKMGYITGNSDNNLNVYLYSENISVEDFEQDINTLYVLPQYYGLYAQQLKEYDSEAKLREMPEELISFYSKEEVATPAIQPEPASVLPDPVPNAKEQMPQVKFSDRLEAIIEAALQDGVLTQKEKEVILRRAEKEGEDIDEFEMLFDARLAQLGIKVEESKIEEPSVAQAPEMPQKDSSKGPDGLFSERLEFLIHNAIEAGPITEKVREVISRRAQAEGEDLDEVEIYIQSLLQKRQQELNKEMKSNQELQEKSDMEYEQKRAETLRKCPKCGAYIPHLSNVCPDCGFIIEKNDTDRKISTLVALLRSCIDEVDCDYDANIELSSYTEEVIIKKEMYEEFPNCYLLSLDQSGIDPSTVRVDYNYSGILAESYMYRDNDTINSMLLQLHRKEKDIIMDRLLSYKNFCDRHKVGRGVVQLRKYYDKLKHYYNDIIDDAEFASIEDSIKKYL